MTSVKNLPRVLSVWKYTYVARDNFINILFSICVLSDHALNMSDTWKKGKRKVQGVPQSQTAALPRPQEEEETDKSKQAQTEQTNEKH